MGETGRDVGVRLDEHKRACRRGDSDNAIAVHSLGLDHRIGFSVARLVFISSNICIRKTVEGALISLNSTFKNNKNSAKENSLVSFILCSELKIKNACNIVATLSPAALPLSSQVGELPLRDTHAMGAYADPLRRPPDPDPPEDNRDMGRAPLRRSLRLQARQQRN